MVRMAGLIVRKDIDLVRERTDLKAVVEEFVTLRSAGVGSFKGLCPFHDERTPSFHVRPGVGTYHCFGCGAHGDVISFLMELEHTTFMETVERLASRVGVELHYEDGGTGPDKAETGRRRRLFEANKVADEFFRRALGSPEAQAARDFLTQRGFTQEHAAQFGLGYAPQGWSHLLDHLRQRGFRDEELRASGLVSEGQRGLYDRFRGRLLWPIRDMTGATIGFGARKLYDDDPGPKYLNTPETPLYKKSQVLYGIDLAKRTIAKERQLVLVEGYTDVMAAHLAGVGTAVATCGTAFGADHIKVARRLISDDGTGGEVIFTFDGDEAGQKAALKAFDEDHRFLAKTFVAVEPSGMDPCDLRMQKGDEAVRALIASRRPLFEFAIRAGLKDYDLNTVEGRAGALRHAAPIVAGIKDAVLRPGYERELAGWLGMDPNAVHRAVAQAGLVAATASLDTAPREGGAFSAIEKRPEFGTEAAAVPGVRDKLVTLSPARGAFVAEPSAEEARQIVDTVRYAYPRDHEDRLVICMIESADTVKNELDAMLKVDGVDVFFVGPNDLAQSMGYTSFTPYGLEPPADVDEMVERALGKISAAGKVGGTLTKADRLNHWLQKGARFIYYHSDPILRQGISAFQAQLR
mgnify:CR=1 FL=1